MRVDFYLISQPSMEAKLHLACRILEKAYHRNHQVYINAASVAEAESLDTLLWTYKDISFIPHSYQQPIEPRPSIQIGHQETSPKSQDILMNLDSQIPDYHDRFHRIIEIVGSDPTQKQIARTHYRFYQAQQYDCFTQKIPA